MSISPVHIRYLGRQDYAEVFAHMQAFNAARDAGTMDEIWLLEHEPVFTLGLNGKPEHVLDAGTIPLMQTDRGGQVTYHGPGQLIAYPLLNLRRNHLGVRDCVTRLEHSVIDFLAELGVDAYARPEAPGVYVGGAKIAALGLRVKRGCSYHGLSLNVDLDLAPFQRINPCGYPGLEVTSLQQLGLGYTMAQTQTALLPHLLRQFNLQSIESA